MQLVQIPNPPFAAGAAPRSGPKTVLGSYELLAQIGGGKFCTVHRARAVASSARPEVVVKRLRSAHQDPHGRARLLREARVGLGLRSRNLVRVLEIHAEPEPFLVLEHIAGATLHELSARARGINSLRYMLPILVDALHGLSALHNWQDEEGAPSFLVHQAPSARHMLVGVDGATRLIDLAHTHDGRALAPSANIARSIDPSELAPEQLRPHTSLDPRCDLFIVGTVLQQALVRATEAREGAAGSQQARARCAALHSIALRARAERRSARYWSAEQMAYAIQKAALEADLFATPIAIGAWVRNAPENVFAVPGKQRSTSRRRSYVPPPPPPGTRVIPAPIPLFGHARTSSTPDAPSAAPPPVERVSAESVSAKRASEPPSAAAVVAAVAPSARAESPAALLLRSGLNRAVGVASGAALLASILAVGVRGLHHTPTASASLRPAPAAVPAVGVEPQTRPLVTSLASKSRARAVPAPSPLPVPVEPAQAPADDVSAEDPRVSTAETIEESIRVVERERALARKGQAVRPRMLRAELPTNPY